jgi:alpha-ribazole phosphatase
MDLYLIRHLEIETAAENKCIGQTDVPLSQKGQSGVADMTNFIADLKPERVISSDLQRCAVLAKAVGKKLGVDSETSASWREIYFGRWEERRWRDIEITDSIALQAWMNDIVRVTPPDGESFERLYNRISLQVDLLTQRPEQTFVVITHAGPIRAALCHAIGLPLAKAFSVDITYGGMAHLKHNNGQWTLTELRN